MQDQGNETDRGVRPDSLGQAMVNRANLDFIFQDPETAFDVSQSLVDFFTDGFILSGIEASSNPGVIEKILLPTPTILGEDYRFHRATESAALA
jgi:hypothetical protein